MWTAIVIIVLIAAVTRILLAKQKSEADRANEADYAHLASNEEALREEVEALQERIKVLERIATDDLKARRLADEIDDLRKD